jgi:hypothetical protein
VLEYVCECSPFNLPLSTLSLGLQSQVGPQQKSPEKWLPAESHRSHPVHSERAEGSWSHNPLESGAVQLKPQTKQIRTNISKMAGYATEVRKGQTSPDKCLTPPVFIYFYNIGSSRRAAKRDSSWTDRASVLWLPQDTTSNAL